MEWLSHAEHFLTNNPLFVGAWLLLLSAKKIFNFIESIFKLIGNIQNIRNLWIIGKRIGFEKSYAISRKWRFWNKFFPASLKINDAPVRKLFIKLLEQEIENPESASRDVLDIFSKLTREDVKLIQKASQFEINGIISRDGIGETGSTNHVMSGNSDLLSSEDIRNLYDKGLTRNDPACHHPVYVKTEITADSNVNLPAGEYEFNYGYLTLSKEASSIFLFPPELGRRRSNEKYHEGISLTGPGLKIMSLVDGEKCPYILKQLNYTGYTDIKINLPSDLDIPVSEHDIINGFYVDEQSHTMNNQTFINIILNEGVKQGVDFSPYNTAKMEEKKKIESELRLLAEVFGDWGLAPPDDPRTIEWRSLSEKEGIIKFLQKRDISVNDENIETVQSFISPS